MLKRHTPAKAHDGVLRVLLAPQTRRYAAPYHSSSPKTNRPPARTSTDALNQALDSALAEYDETDPFREFKKHGSGSRPHTDLLTGETHFKRDDVEKPPLPLPPFLRNKKLEKLNETRLNKIKDTNELRFGRSDVPKLGKLMRDKYKSVGESKKKAPFTARFAENPWARALGTPVRECRRTDVRLPTGCLIDFHLVESAKSEDIRENGERADDASSGPARMELMPLSMALDLLPTHSKYRKFTKQGQMLEKLARQATLRRQPRGIASYVASHYSILDSIAANFGNAGQRRKDSYLRRFAASRIVGNVMQAKYGEGAHLHWRTDMADYVLKGLRALVIKRLRYWVLRKSHSENEGTIMQVTGGGMLDGPGSHGGLHGSQGVEMLDDVICVLRLRPETGYETNHTENFEPQVGCNPQIQIDGDQGRPEAHPGISGSESLRSLLVESRANPQASAPQAPAEHNTTQSGISSAQAKPLLDPLSGTSSESQADSTPYKQTDSRTYIKPDSAFLNTSHTPGYLLGLMPLPPDHQPSSLYCPTLPYRGRRVPMYDLYYLLGPDITEDLLKDTVFSNSRYVALKSSLGTFQLVGTLSKLMVYLGTSKTEFLDKIEQHMQECAHQAKGMPETPLHNLA